jgi:hypothetical protein
MSGSWQCGDLGMGQDGKVLSGDEPDTSGAEGEWSSNYVAPQLGYLEAQQVGLTTLEKLAAFQQSKPR